MRLPAYVACCASLAVLLGLGRLPAAAGAAGEAAQKVREALADYEAGDYTSAARAYAEADAALPNHPRILFDRGAVLAAEGETARAEALFQKVTELADREIAARARYNLGCLAAEKARVLFGDGPEDAPPDVRRKGMDLLDRAAEHYRECLRLEHGHADARHNLEIIRLFAARMRKAWRDHDRTQTGSAAPHKRPPEKEAAKEPPKKGPGEEEGKPDHSGRPKEDERPPGPDEQPKAVGEEQQPKAVGVADHPLPKPSPIAESDPARQQAQRLIDRVRQRSREKRQWDRKRQTSSWTQVEEKNW
ncbi:MAG: hypothetical protein ISS78_10310 [Phycisphaerae bacterium]|nr:hypothetical protein [Phycisphaerae bacterium]